LKLTYVDTYKLVPTATFALRLSSYDVLVSNNQTSWAVGAVLHTFKVRRHIVILHGTDIREACLPKPRRIVALRLLRRNNLVFGTTPDLVEAGRKYGISVTYLPVPISTHRFAPAQRPSKQPRRILVFSPTRLDDTKGAQLIVQLLERLAIAFDDADIFQVGWGQQRYLDRLNRGKVGRRIKILDWIPREEMARWYHKADLVIGQFGLGIASAIELEAMSCGVPVIFFDKWYGYGLASPSLEMAYDFSLAAIRDSKHRQDIVQKGLQIVGSHHDSDIVAARFLGAVSSLLAHPAPSGLA
jgi:glycosyltransferase involved in cell wall biosynthesis